MQKLKEELRKSIIEETGKLIAEKGVDKFTMREVAERTGITAGNLYHYFSGKQELIDQIVKPVLDKFNLMIHEVTRNQSIDLYEKTEAENIKVNLEILVSKLVEIYIENTLVMNLLDSDIEFRKDIVIWLKDIIRIINKEKYQEKYLEPMSEVLAQVIVDGIAMILNEKYFERYSEVELKEILMAYLKVTIGE